MYLTQIEKKQSQKGNEYTMLHIMDEQGRSGKFFPARTLDVGLIKTELVSKFPNDMKPIEVVFDVFTDGSAQVLELKKAQK